MQEKQSLVVFKDNNFELDARISIEEDTVWLTQKQISGLFAKSIPTINEHINNVFKEEELKKDSVVRDFRIVASNGKEYLTKHYNLDVIISVGYRVKSARGIKFRKWATSILKKYLIEGYVEDQKKLKEYGKIIKLLPILERTTDQLDSKEILGVVRNYAKALDLLDDYDHQRIKKPKGNKTLYKLEYRELRNFIDKLSFNGVSDLFGKEKDQSFKSSISTIFQTFDKKEVYTSLEEKAANLLYFIVKNHSFVDGNKRIAASVFLYFLDKNNHLYIDNKKIIQDETLVAITIMLAESKSKEKQIMVDLVMNFL